MPVADLDVVMTYCNMRRYVEAAVRSALDQDGFRTRVILVNDASDEELPSGGWPADRVKVVMHESRSGQGAALNTGLAVSDTDLVSFLDSDDLFPAHRSKVLVDALNQAGADLVYGAQVVFNDGEWPQLRFTDEQQRDLPDGKPTLVAGTLLLRRALVDSAGPFPQDVAMSPLAAWLTDARRRAAPIEATTGQVVLLRRSHATNMSRGATRAEDYQALLARLRRQQ